MGLVPYKKEPPQKKDPIELPRPFYHVRTQGEVGGLQLRTQPRQHPEVSLSSTSVTNNFFLTSASSGDLSFSLLHPPQRLQKIQKQAGT